MVTVHWQACLVNGRFLLSCQSTLRENQEKGKKKNGRQERAVFSMDFPGGSDGKASVCNAGDLGSIPGSGGFPEEGNGNHSSTLA